MLVLIIYCEPGTMPVAKNQSTKPEFTVFQAPPCWMRSLDTSIEGVCAKEAAQHTDTATGQGSETVTRHLLSYPAHEVDVFVDGWFHTSWTEAPWPWAYVVYCKDTWNNVHNPPLGGLCPGSVSATQLGRNLCLWCCIFDALQREPVLPTSTVEDAGGTERHPLGSWGLGSCTSVS